MNNAPTVRQPDLALPRGGGAIAGLGSAIGSGTSSGDASFSVDPVITPARALTPSITLVYSSAAGNGPFGMGFSTSVAQVRRRTTTGVPTYRDDDAVELSGVGALVPVLRPDRTPDTRDDDGPDGVRHRVTAFRPVLETDLPLIERWEPARGGASHWVVTTSDGTVERYGISNAGRVADPAAPDERVAAWLLEERTDTHGNRAVYAYAADDDTRAADTSGPAAQRYPTSVRYGNHRGAGDVERFALEVVFDYGERDLDHLDAAGAAPYDPVRPWPPRADPFSSYTTGFEVRTSRLCRAVLMFHHFPDELGAAPCLVSSLRCHYDEAPTVSRLTRVVRAGHRRRPDGSYASVELPPLDLTWSEFAPPPAPRFDTLQVEGGDSPGPLGRGRLQPVDLHGDGLTGLLYSDDATTYYYEPEGAGRYARASTPDTFPNVHDLRDPRLSLEDVDAAGRLDLVVTTPSAGGYFPRGEDGGWQPFRPFGTVPGALSMPHGELVDLTGDGRSDLLHVYERSLIAHPSRGGDGYGAQLVAERPPRFPTAQAQPDGDRLVTFAGIFGDGMAHRVLVTDGRVEVWPNLGHGRFGAPVAMAGAPAFGPGVTPGRILFADVDGSGTADLVLVGSDRLTVHINQAGNGFAPPVTVPLPVRPAEPGGVAFADVLGTGTTAVVATAGPADPRHWFCDLNAGVKPYLLTGVDDHVGMTTRLEYAPSTRFALQDRRAGRPWTTRLPFPVQVVEKVSVTDAVSGTRVVRRHRYRDGWFDPVLREFGGFGFVESWDAETFDELLAAARDDDRVATPRAERHAAAVRTRSWFHVGSLRQSEALRAARRREQFGGDPLAAVAPSDVLDDGARAAGGPTLEQAHTSLTGRVLRTEVYADDGGPAAELPYAVTDTSYTVRLLQPAHDGARGAFHLQLREVVDVGYERRRDDPRVGHTFCLEDTLVDPGDATTYRQRVLTVHYPRRDGPPGPGRVPEQAVAHATLAETVRTRVRTPFRMVGAPVAERELDLGGLPLAPGAALTFGDAGRFVDAALASPIPYGEPFTGGSAQSRPSTEHRSFYWDEAQTAVLPLGRIAARALPHHGTDAAFPPGWVTAVYGDDVTTADLTAAGYVWDDGTATWWRPGPVTTHHGPDSYCLPERTDGPDTGPLRSTTVVYDAYRLHPVTVTRTVDPATSLTTQALLDYQIVAPWQVTDPNGVVSQVLPDPLGGAMAMSTFRPGTATSPRVGDGDLRDYVVRDGATAAAVLTDPLAHLQDAGAYYLVDLHTDGTDGTARPRPLTTVEVRRPRHTTDGLATADELLVRVTLRDGTGRTVAELAACAPEEAGPDQAAPGPLWRVSGRVVHDNKGRAVERHLPTYVTAPDPQLRFASGPPPDPAAPPPEVTWYDPLGRPVRVDTPKGFFSRTTWTAWEEHRHDAVDTVLESSFHRDFLAQLPADPSPDALAERDALQKAAPAYHTPSITVLDPLARPVRHIRDNLGSVPADRLEPVVAGTATTAQQLWEALVTAGYLESRDTTPVGTWPTDRFDPYTPGFALRLDPPFDVFADAVTELLLPGRTTDLRVLDGRGRAVRLTDPRLHLDEVRSGTERASLRCAYPMGAAAPARVDSADAGTHLMLTDASGAAVLSIDARGVRTSTTFDGLSRPCTVKVAGAVRERFTYGESAEDAAEHGLLGRPWRVEDGSGTVTTSDYGIAGVPLRTVRQFVADAHAEPDWSGPVALDPERYETVMAYDALGVAVATTSPDGRTVRHAFHRSGTLREIVVDPPGGGGPVTVATAMRYDASARRVAATFGNGVVRTSRYERTTGRLLALHAARADGTPVQDVRYTCDPAGNVTLVRDSTARYAYGTDQPDGRADLSYDPLYRLRSATGLQLPGLFAETYATGVKQTVFAPLRGDPASVLEPWRETYRYDLADNLVALTHDAASGSWSRTMPVADDSNRLAGEPYDAAGNMLALQRAGTVSLTWDDRGRLRSACTPDGSGTVECYDATGARVRHRADAADGSWTERRHLGSCLVDLAGDREPTTTLRVGDGHGTVAELARDGVRWELDDRLGSVGVQLDAAGAVVGYEAFLPHGGSSAISAADEAGVASKTHRFSGKETDDDTGLAYFGARYAVPWLGRWLSPDPAGPVDGLNLYAYVKGNPLTLHDRHGTNGTNSDTVWGAVVRLAPVITGLTLTRAHLSLQIFGKGIGGLLTHPLQSPERLQVAARYRAENWKVIVAAVEELRYEVRQQVAPNAHPIMPPPASYGTSPLQWHGRPVSHLTHVTSGFVAGSAIVGTAAAIAKTHAALGRAWGTSKTAALGAGVWAFTFTVMSRGTLETAVDSHEREAGGTGQTGTGSRITGHGLPVHESLYRTFEKDSVGGGTALVAMATAMVGLVGAARVGNWSFKRYARKAITERALTVIDSRPASSSSAVHHRQS